MSSKPVDILERPSVAARADRVFELVFELTDDERAGLNDAATRDPRVQAAVNRLSAHAAPVAMAVLDALEKAERTRS